MVLCRAGMTSVEVWSRAGNALGNGLPTYHLSSAYPLPLLFSNSLELLKN